MADPEDTQDTQAALRSLRLRVLELEQQDRRPVDGSRMPAAGSALAAALVVLTATTWAVEAEEPYTPYTLWGLVPENWLGLTMLALVVGTALATFTMFLSESPPRVGHLVMVWVALLTATWVIVMNGVVPEDSGTTPGRWLTLLLALALSCVHGFRAEELYVDRKGSKLLRRDR